MKLTQEAKDELQCFILQTVVHKVRELDPSTYSLI